MVAEGGDFAPRLTRRPAARRLHFTSFRSASLNLPFAVGFAVRSVALFVNAAPHHQPALPSRQIPADSGRFHIADSMRRISALRTTDVEHACNRLGVGRHEVVSDVALAIALTVERDAELLQLERSGLS